ncbi:MAG TPA: DUF5654 family protein [Candidatus Pacearchaeota archaeon]|nr:DUF5654 family protein [Candidatus Pacearchaeota archaeon]
MIKKLTKEQILKLERIKPQVIHERAKKEAHSFKKEFKKQMNTAILAAFGFLIALVWKDVITTAVEKISDKAPFGGAIVSALLVTTICVVGIMFFSRILKNEEDKK